MPEATRVVVIGGGFAGLAAAQRLRGRRGVEVLLIDRNNHHLFQPLLYQVATGGLSPANIAVPLRSLFRRKQNVTVLQDKVESIDLDACEVRSASASYPFDHLIVAAGGETSYYGNDGWSDAAPGLKTLADATKIRARVLASLEAAETSHNGVLPTYVIAGGGPSGVEMSGAIAELTRLTLRGEFRRIDPAAARMLLVDPGDRLLASYPPELSKKAADRLADLGVEVELGKSLKEVAEGRVTIGNDGTSETLEPAVAVWAAGVVASPLAAELAKQTGIEPAAGGRLPVDKNLNLECHLHVHVVGDLAHCLGTDGNPLPGVAPVAIQQGKHAANNVLASKQNKKPRAFRYQDYGAMAVIGRGAAVAELRGWKLSGYPAWLAWLFVHLLQLVGYQNRLLVACQWAWNYVTRNRSARLITESPPRE